MQPFVERDRFGRSASDGWPVINQQHAIGELPGEAEIVRKDDHRDQRRVRGIWKAAVAQVSR